jgi:hypothetical protein
MRGYYQSTANTTGNLLRQYRSIQASLTGQAVMNSQMMCIEMQLPGKCFQCLFCITVFLCHPVLPVKKNLV